MCLKKFKIEMNSHKHGNNMEIISNQEFKNPEADINERSSEKLITEISGNFPDQHFSNSKY